MARPHIQVILADDAIPASLQAALQRTTATTGFWPLSEAVREGCMPAADAIVVVVPEDLTEVAGPLRLLFDRLAEQPRATLILKTNGETVQPLQHPPTLPVTFYSGNDEHDLTGRLVTMLEISGSLDSLHRRMLANRHTGENIAQRYFSQLRLASQVQREFLPEVLPRFGAVSFDLVFRPVDYVSGDIYDVHRLDEDHVGIALADATGHGIPAALLTVYIKRALRGKEIENGSYRILSPDEVLSRLNDDLLEADLSECPFVAAVYAILDIRTYELTLARAGAPYPVFRTSEGELELLLSSGGVVGVLPNSRFEVITLQMQPGDSLLIYSDGLERIVAPEQTAREVPEELIQAAGHLAAVAEKGDEPVTAMAEAEAYMASAGGTTATIASPPHTGSRFVTEPRSVTRPNWLAGLSAAAAHELITDSPWYATLRNEGPSVALEQVSERQRTLRRIGYPLDDLTVLCLQIDD
ncbi:MAG: SpoIIE family protein phosphatase [Phycisphaerae bacterium]|nr:SpoIIE family protein phosphatase [Phycisphaerae bacterium]